MIQPPPLKQGDTIGIAATARKISADELQFALDTFTKAGLKVKFAPELFEINHQFAGSDAQRAKGFQTLLDDDEVKAIIIARGGYGTVRLIDQLQFESLLRTPKWIIGYSDVTVLHSHIQRHVNMQTIHGPMCLNMMSERFDQESIDTLLAMLFSNANVEYKTKHHPFNRVGEASGMLTGGNLSVLFSLLGSPSDVDTRGKILFLEDLDEYLYHIDRMMVNMKRNGKLDGLAGLVIGDMSDMRDNAIPFGKQALEIIAEHVSEYNYPVCFGFPAGHEKRNLALRFGANMHLKVTATTSVLIG